MTDRPDSAESAESPEIAEVRRLLAAARHVDPMPDDVAGRMEDVLAGLRDAGPSAPAVTHHPPAAEVVPIAAHRRRRAAALLVAAAAVVVGGVTVAPHLGLRSNNSPGGAATGAEGTADGGRFGSNTGNTGNGKNLQTQQPSAAVSPHLRHGRVVVRPRHFSADALAGRVLLDRKATDAPDYTTQSPLCPDVPRRGSALAAEYQRAPAALVYRRAEGSSQVVDLYVCGNRRPVRSTTLPVP